MMKAEELALVQGMADTKAALRRWSAEPVHVVRAWVAGSLAISVVLLLAIWVVSRFASPDLSGVALIGVHMDATVADYGFVLFRNSLVLALHALACVAGFMAGSSLPVVAEGHSGLLRRIHDFAGPLAIGFVICATLFSLTTQALVLGADLATIANQLHIGRAELLLIECLHALPELVALFLPLAAWTIASRRGQWNDLLAATFATLAISIPVILAAAAVETWVTPEIIRLAAGM
jgi:hypothetical protein